MSIIDAVTHQVCKGQQHFRGCLGAFLNLVANRFHHIENEMGIELLFQLLDFHLPTPIHQFAVSLAQLLEVEGRIAKLGEEQLGFLRTLGRELIVCVVLLHTLYRMGQFPQFLGILTGKNTRKYPYDRRQNKKQEYKQEQPIPQGLNLQGKGRKRIKAKFLRGDNAGRNIVVFPSDL